MKRSFSYSVIFTVIILIVVSPDLASADSFPVGLSLEFEIESRSGFNSNSHMITYEFTRWIDEEQGTIELLIDSTPTEVSYPEGRVIVIASYPLWRDVSDWEVGTTIFGSSFTLSRSTKNGYSCWYIRGEIDGPDDFDGEYWNIYYEISYGFLISYHHITFSGTSFSEQTASLEESNLNSFRFLGGFLDSPFASILLVAGIFIELVIICRFWDRRRGRV